MKVLLINGSPKANGNTDAKSKSYRDTYSNTKSKPYRNADSDRVPYSGT